MTSAQKMKSVPSDPAGRSALGEADSEELLRVLNATLEQIAGGAPLRDTLDLLLRSNQCCSLLRALHVAAAEQGQEVLHCAVQGQ